MHLEDTKPELLYAKEKKETWLQSVGINTAVSSFLGNKLYKPPTKGVCQTGPTVTLFFSLQICER